MRCYQMCPKNSMADLKITQTTTKEHQILHRKKKTNEIKNILRFMQKCAKSSSHSE